MTALDDLSIEELRDLVEKAIDYAEVCHIFDRLHQDFMATFRQFRSTSTDEEGQAPGPKTGPFLVM